MTIATRLSATALAGALAALSLAACGDDLAAPPPLDYTNPPAGGALRLVENPTTTPTAVVLDLVVGDAPLTGYAAGFDLPLAPGEVTMGAFTPGTALDPGRDPIAAKAALPRVGPLKDVLVTAQSQKAAGAGAVATDATLAPGTVLYTIELDLVAGAAPGVVFDGTAPGFHLPSGGLRTKAGLTAVPETDVAIGRLVVR